MTNYHFDWSELAFGSKKAVRELKATFIAAPREMSPARLKQLVKEYLPKGNIIFGIAAEDYILGFENQPQFKTLRPKDLKVLMGNVNIAKLPHKIYTLTYAQRDLKFIIEKLSFKKIVLINGSWKHMFHTLPAYYSIASKKLDYDMVTPFASVAEAIKYAKALPKVQPVDKRSFTANEMLELARTKAKRSFDYCFQTGAVLGCKRGKKYDYLISSFNKVVPYQTYAMHHGSLREINFSPMNDLNYYDTIHAEVALVVKAQKNKLALKGATLFINLLPCPNCARMLCETDIAEVVYHEDHSDGYALKLLEAAGKKVIRVVQ